VVRLELIGHGGSESPASLDPYLMNACAAQIVEVVRQLGLIRPHLLGYSMGGRAALAAALVKPNQFSSLVLVGATAGIAELSRRRERVAEDRALADRIEARPLAEFVEEWMALPLFSSQASLGSAALSRARAQRMKNLPLGLANSLRGMGAGAQPPLFDQLDQLDAPVLLVAGELDTKFRQIATSLQALLPNARTEIISGVGHAAHLEDPIEFAERAVKFFSEPRLAVAGSLSGPAKSVEPVRSDCV
ncbi:MAG: alpha/beta fold hydrolase, partial [Myxococcota bacterium]